MVSSANLGFGTGKKKRRLTAGPSFRPSSRSHHLGNWELGIGKMKAGVASVYTHSAEANRLWTPSAVQSNFPELNITDDNIEFGKIMKCLTQTRFPNLGKFICDSFPIALIAVIAVIFVIAVIVAIFVIVVVIVLFVVIVFARRFVEVNFESGTFDPPSSSSSSGGKEKQKKGR